MSELENTAGSQIKLKDSVSSYILTYYQNHLYHFNLHNIFDNNSSKLLFMNVLCIVLCNLLRYSVVSSYNGDPMV